MLGIIIPVYNRTDDLRMALQSLTTQTKNRFIVFVVDDASDECIKSVCDEFKSLHIQYSRLPINSGPGMARQHGLFLAEKMKIEAVMFLDSDDMLAPNAVARLSYELNHTHADIITSTIVVEHQYAPDNFIDNGHNLTWTHGKIYRMSFLINNKIEFPAINFRTNEDLAFNLCAFEVVDEKKLLGIDQQLYLFRDNKKSITRNNSDETLHCTGIDYIWAIIYYINYCLKNNIRITKITNLINCYQYYQSAKLRGTEIPYEIDIILKGYFKNPIIKEKLKYRGVWYNLNIPQYIIFEKKFYFFEESLVDWLKRLEFDFSILGEE